MKPSEFSLEGFRDYLDLLIRLQTGLQRFQGKLDLSGVVQQTLLEAHHALRELEGMETPQVAAWLRHALDHNLADEIRRLSADKRAISREQALEYSLDKSASRLEMFLAADQTSPSQRVHKNERLLHLASALQRLPENQRQAVELHHLLGMTLAEVAGKMQTTQPAVAGLIFRGLKRLRELLSKSDE